nr:TPA_exp: major sperm protein 124-3 [Enoplus brevis]
MTMPGEIKTQPENKLIFGAPFDAPVTVSLRATNAGGKKIGWAIKTTNMRRFSVEPGMGTMEPKAHVNLSVTCNPFDIGNEDISNDRITIEWTDTPAGAGNKFQREWFQGSGIIRRKVINCEYNV